MEEEIVPHNVMAVHRMAAIGGMDRTRDSFVIIALVDNHDRVAPYHDTE